MPKFIVTADTGSGSSDQYKVARSMEKINRLYRINSALLLGDNIYETGVTSHSDPQFKTKFEIPYRNLSLPVYLCLGNHDYGNTLFRNNNADHQISYSDISNKWNMPSKYYSIQKGPCEFFFLDTNFDNMNESSIVDQFHAMTTKIKKSRKKWKIICGHHPWRSVGGHGNAENRFEQFMNDLCRMKGITFDLYMCGHDHCKNIILKKHPANQSTITLLVIGTGGKKYHSGDPQLHNMKEGDSELLFHSPNLGICLIDATRSRLKLTCYNEILQEEFSHFIRKE